MLPAYLFTLWILIHPLSHLKTSEKPDFANYLTSLNLLSSPVRQLGHTLTSQVYGEDKKNEYINNILQGFHKCWLTYRLCSVVKNMGPVARNPECMFSSGSTAYLLRMLVEILNSSETCFLISRKGRLRNSSQPQRVVEKSNELMYVLICRTCLSHSQCSKSWPMLLLEIVCKAPFLHETQVSWL